MNCEGDSIQYEDQFPAKRKLNFGICRRIAFFRFVDQVSLPDHRSAGCLFVAYYLRVILNCLIWCPIGPCGPADYCLRYSPLANDLAFSYGSRYDRK
jgi:hypothetical protein